jgi:uncharacterized membrane protein YqjE
MGLGQAAKTVSERASSIVRLELELAALELKQKAANLGFGIGLGIGSAVFVFFAIGVGITTVIAALAIVLDVWLAALIVFLSLLLIAGILAWLAVSRVQRATPPMPEQAIEEARRTREAIKSNGSPEPPAAEPVAPPPAPTTATEAPTTRFRTDGS